MGKFSYPEEAQLLIDSFNINKYPLYFVGGCVRDFLLGLQPKDWDLASGATPALAEAIVRGMGWKVLILGKSFGVITAVSPSGIFFEIATFRKDTSSGRKPSVVFSSIEDDVQRRDLTINAIFYDPTSKKILDLVGGINDLRKRIIRTVGKPSLRFREDNLRKLRAFRFLGMIDGVFDTDTAENLLANPHLDVSEERIREEWIKIIKQSVNPSKVVLLLEKYGYLSKIFYGFDGYDLNLTSPKIVIRDYILYTAYLMKDLKLLPRDLDRILDLMRWPFTDRKKIIFLVNLKNFQPEKIIEFKKSLLIAEISEEQICQWIQITGCNDLKFINDFVLTIKSSDVIKEGFTDAAISREIAKREGNIYRRFIS